MTTYSIFTFTRIENLARIDSSNKICRNKTDASQEYVTQISLKQIRPTIITREKEKMRRM